MAAVIAALGVNWFFLCKNCLANERRTQTKRDIWMNRADGLWHEIL
jgi:hypothetical protein